MRNKKLVYYALLPAVGIVWGIIIFKVAAVFGGEEEIVQEMMKPSVVTSQTSLSDTFTLFLQYTDPFLGKKIIQTSPDAIKKNLTVKNTPKKEIVKAEWPHVQYAGMIRNEAKDKKLGHVTVNGAQVFCSAGDTVSGILVKKIYNDSILLQFHKEQKFIVKSSN